MEDLSDLRMKALLALPNRSASGLFSITKEATPELIGALRTLLANTISVYHEAHGFHWNVKGQDFSQYHSLFSEIYGALYDSVDPIAENILKLGVDAPFQLSELVALRSISESKATNSPMDMASALLNSLTALLSSLNMAFQAATRSNEQGIANFISERIDDTQKWMWQLRSSTGVQKGDFQGHPFRGNQHTSGKGNRKAIPSKPPRMTSLYGGGTSGGGVARSGGKSPAGSASWKTTESSVAGQKFQTTRARVGNTNAVVTMGTNGKYIATTEMATGFARGQRASGGKTSQHDSFESAKKAALQHAKDAEALQGR